MSQSDISPLVFFSLTPEEDEAEYPEYEEEYQWVDDSECQENLFNILTLVPEESTIDEDNKIHTSIKLFFEELGYLTEEPEPIDPSIDYEEEGRIFLSQRNNKARKNHVDLVHIPSLDSNISGLSSSSSSLHHEQIPDVRSPHFMGGHINTTHTDQAYQYGAYLDTKPVAYYQQSRPNRLH